MENLSGSGLAQPRSCAPVSACSAQWRSCALDALCCFPFFCPGAPWLKCKAHRTALHAYVTHLLNATFAGRPQTQTTILLNTRLVAKAEKGTGAFLACSTAEEPWPGASTENVSVYRKTPCPVGDRMLTIIAGLFNVAGKGLGELKNCHDHATLVVPTKVGCIDDN